MMLRLHTPWGENTWCGPTALSIVTGEASDTFARYLDPDGKSMLLDDFLKALRDHGFSARRIPLTTSFWEFLGFADWREHLHRRRITFGRVLRYIDKIDPKHKSIYVFATGLHLVVYDPRVDSLADNGYMHSSVPRDSRLFSRRRVISELVAIDGIE